MNNQNIFNPKVSQDVSSKIVTGLERISEVFKLLLWKKAKHIGLSPIQIQILVFVAFHKSELCNVSHLAKEFNITKPTISDAIKVLLKKEMIFKDHSPTDQRSYTIQLTDVGKDIVAETNDFAAPLKAQVDSFDETQLNGFFDTLSSLIYKLNQSELLTVQRTCYACRFYQKNDNNDYCNLLQATLKSHDIRIDCPEFEEK
ncbi:MarR family winged helix-turn-helix transcriptional regulator [Kordia sp.]|uniref:MarR family winged helix-turn-helix transcriptional regulator n=1 Tax=Kordia sp. TaxID=1965332 RepID=UPI0025C1CB4A|nr:MarR family winged helix-turn-helix transcriptional regulator [Kordia sp.]MCH2196106.1 MarR family winged helix-turn-helix transcriptional regulator [Kordia sp.]